MTNYAQSGTPAEIAQAQRRAWDDVAPGWAKHQSWSDTAMAPLFHWFVDACALEPGMRVLDVACGPGEPALTMAARVGDDRVVGIDISPRMIAAARERSRVAGRRLEFVEMPMEQLAFTDHSFDAVTSCCGVKFAADPVVAIREMLRVTRPGGRVSVAVWDKPLHNPFLAVMGRAVAAVADLPPPSSEIPGPFRLSAPGALEDVMRRGGASEVEVSSLSISLPYASVEEYVRKALELGPGLATRIAALSDEARHAFERLVVAGLTPFASESGFLLPGRAHCAVAQRT